MNPSITTVKLKSAADPASAQVVVPTTAIAASADSYLSTSSCDIPAVTVILPTVTSARHVAPDAMATPIVLHLLQHLLLAPLCRLIDYQD